MIVPSGFRMPLCSPSGKSCHSRVARSPGCPFGIRTISTRALGGIIRPFLGSGSDISPKVGWMICGMGGIRVIFSWKPASPAMWIMRIPELAAIRM